MSNLEQVWNERHLKGLFPKIFKLDLESFFRATKSTSNSLLRGTQSQPRSNDAALHRGDYPLLANVLDMSWTSDDERNQKKAAGSL